MKNENSVVSFMKLYNKILCLFKNDDDHYNIFINYNEKNNFFSIIIINETKKINAFYNAFTIDSKKASEFKNIIRNDFIKNHEIYLPYIQNDYENKTHIIKNHKFTLYIPITENEINDTFIAQKKALKKIKFR